MGTIVSFGFFCHVPIGVGLLMGYARTVAQVAEYEPISCLIRFLVGEVVGPDVLRADPFP